MPENGIGPERIAPVYTTHEANEEVELGIEPVALIVRDKTVSGQGRISLRFLPRPLLVCEVELEGDTTVTSGDVGDRFQLTAHGVEVPAFASSTQWVSGGKQHCRVTMVPNPNVISLGDAQVPCLRRATFHLVNFYDFFGASQTIHRTETGGAERLGLANLVADPWKVTIVLLPGARENMKSMQATGGYAITHVGCIEKEDGACFTGAEADGLLQSLHYFLSFARGCWSAPMLLVGFDESDGEAVKLWGVRRLDSWRYGDSWFDPNHADLLESVFPAFMSKLTSSVWGEHFRHAVYWYLEANSDAHGTETRLIIAQVALELVSWVYCVNDRKLISAEGLRDIRASDKIRMLLSSLDIPLAVPSELTDLTKGCKSFQWMDGPQALTEVRNSLVHPGRTRERRYGEILADAWKLSLWYIELALLRSCGHSGKYSNRLAQHWVGEVEDVPWAKTQQPSERTVSHATEEEGQEEA